MVFAVDEGVVVGEVEEGEVGFAAGGGEVDGGYILPLNLLIASTLQPTVHHRIRKRPIHQTHPRLARQIHPPITHPQPINLKRLIKANILPIHINLNEVIPRRNDHPRLRHQILHMEEFVGVLS